MSAYFILVDYVPVYTTPVYAIPVHNTRLYNIPLYNIPLYNMQATPASDENIFWLESYFDQNIFSGANWTEFCGKPGPGQPCFPRRCRCRNDAEGSRKFDPLKFGRQKPFSAFQSPPNRSSSKFRFQPWYRLPARWLISQQCLYRPKQYTIPM